MRKNTFQIFLCCLALSFSCALTPTKPENPIPEYKQPRVNAGSDTSIFIQDTIHLHGTGTLGEDSMWLDSVQITHRYWELIGPAQGLGDSTRYDYAFIAPAYACTIFAILNVETNREESAADTILVIVLGDTTVLIEKKYYSADSILVGRYAYEYGPDTILHKLTVYQGDSTRIWWEEYLYRSGQKQKTTRFKADSTKNALLVHTYGSNALLTRTDSYNGDSSTLQSYTTYDYVTDGRLSKSTSFGPDDTPWYSVEYSYGADSKLSSQTMYSPSGQKGNYSLFNYDSTGRIIREKTFNPTGQLGGWYNYKYRLFHKIDS